MQNFAQTAIQPKANIIIIIIIRDRLHLVDFLCLNFSLNNTVHLHARKVRSADKMNSFRTKSLQHFL